MAKSDIKTNVMRILEQRGIAYTPHRYDAPSGAVSGKDVAEIIGKPTYQVFKTLVTKGASREHYVFVIPVSSELNLKLAASAVGEKSIEMIKQAELLPLTGYVHGGCSPIGMKKSFFTVFDEEIILLDTVIVSAGKIGWQVELSPDDIISITGGKTAPLTSS